MFRDFLKEVAVPGFLIGGEAEWPHHKNGLGGLHDVSHRVLDSDAALLWKINLTPNSVITG